jgi:hypothetical protein
MKISPEKEQELLASLLDQLPEVDPRLTLVLNISPDYSSTVSMHVAHHLSLYGRMLDIASVDVPYPKESADSYKRAFASMLPVISAKYEQVILCEAAILSGKNYTWIVDMLMGAGFDRSDIITTALVERDGSVFKSDYVGGRCRTMPDFYFEKYNFNWDGIE